MSKYHLMRRSTQRLPSAACHTARRRLVTQQAPGATVFAIHLLDTALSRKIPGHKGARSALTMQLYPTTEWERSLRPASS
ncbi:hypothetical protein BDU57DRAFT_508146 [Ampelomyces quisqualis]|uniref:Uncharacterized protein n=1 Tax=Ampelomyces quisqualis TaxID=50730 RepID=A0A6A5QX96_AMPQU|nr:hypothetical protein BDU57DRAFT_508146 [Ampelomyces quisqualis]